MPMWCGGGEDRMIAPMTKGCMETPRFAPPFLKAGKLVIAQTANILRGGRHCAVAASSSTP